MKNIFFLPINFLKIDQCVFGASRGSFNFSPSLFKYRSLDCLIKLEYMSALTLKIVISFSFLPQRIELFRALEVLISLAILVITVITGDCAVRDKKIIDILKSIENR